MVKLYYTPTSCGAASFIAALAAQVSLQTEQVDIKEHKTASGVYNFLKRNNVNSNSKTQSIQLLAFSRRSRS